MFRFSLLLLSLFSAFSSVAQPIAQYRNSFRVGINLTTLDAPDGRGLHYVGRYARHFGNDRVVVAAEGGYLFSERANRPFNSVDPSPNQRSRLTADLTGLFDFIRSPAHALRLGLGVSAWYRRDDTYRGATATFTPTGKLSSVAIDRIQRRGINTGAHVALEYEWLFTPRTGFDVRARFSDLEQAGISSTIGAGLNYRF